MFKDTTYLELEPYAEHDRLIAIVQCDELSIRSPGTRSERQEIRATVRTAAVLPAGAELQLWTYAQGAPLMTVGRNYLIAAHRASTSGPWELVEARPSSGANAVQDWEAAQAELGRPGSSDVTQQMGVAEQLVLDDRVAQTSSHGLTLQVLGADIASEPPPKPGVSRPSTTRIVIRVRVALGHKTEELTFTPESPGIASLTDHEWEGYRIELVDRTLTKGTRDQWITTFTVTPTNAPSAGKPTEPTQRPR